MAIKWNTKVNVLDIKRGNVSVTLQQVDDTDPDNVKVLKTFSVLDALIDTDVHKQQVFDELERQYNVDKQDAVTKIGIIGTLTDDVTAAANTWEAK